MGSADAKELAGKTTDAAEAYAKKWFGLGAAERGWHEKLGTDPYTTNVVLRRRIKELSKVAAAGPGRRKNRCLRQFLHSDISL